MANESRFTLRHGDSAPPDGALLPYELGYTDTGELYIGLPNNTDDTINTNKLLVPAGLSDLPTSISELEGRVKTAEGDINQLSTDLSDLNDAFEDLDTTYLGINDKAKDSEKADSATKAIQDGEENVISLTYAKLDKDGQVLSAKTATKATQDSEGNTISSTYLKLSGGTLTGNLIISQSSGGLLVQSSEKDLQVSMLIGSGKINHGIWTTGYSSDEASFTSQPGWMIYRNNQGQVVLPLTTNLAGPIILSESSYGAETNFVTGQLYFKTS